MKVIESPGLPWGFRYDREEPGCRLDIGPTGFLYGEDARGAIAKGDAQPLCGGPVAFGACRVFCGRSGEINATTVSLTDLIAWSEGQDGATATRAADGLAGISAPRPSFAGISVDRPVIVGIVNATPDSFSDGGAFADPNAAIDHGLALIDAGADIIDIGGESTRPGAHSVGIEEELARVMPVIAGLASNGAVLSIDTRKAPVMRAAMEGGVRVINDVSALTDDPGAMNAARDAAGIILMHKRGAPAAMHHNPSYGHAPYEIYRYLDLRVKACVDAGIGPERIVVDPGIGFGKSAADDRRILRDIALFHGLGHPIMLGASRKFGGGPSPKGRLAPSLAAATLGAARGVQIFRVHDVAETRDALTLLSKSWVEAGPGAT